MKNTQTLAKSVVSHLTTSSTTLSGNRASENHQSEGAREQTQQQHREISVRVNQVFAVFRSVWNSQFEREFPTKEILNDTRKQWSTSVGFRALSSCEFQRGIILMRDRFTYIPKLSQFLELCRGSYEDLGLPSVEQAWQEVANHCHEQMTYTWSHEAIYTAAQATDFYRIRRATGDEVKALRKSFEAHYLQLRNRIARGEQIPDVRPALEDARSKSPVELNEQYHEAKLQAEIKAQGLQQLTSAKSALAAMRSRLA